METNYGGTKVNVKKIKELFKLEIAAGQSGLDREVEGCYCGDLLSDVMGNAPSNSLWLTVQSHQNILAVAVLRELAGIILVNSVVPDEETKQKAKDENIPILCSPLPAYQLAGELYMLGIGRTEA